MRLIKSAIKEELEHLGIKYDKPKNQGEKMSLEKALLILFDKYFDIHWDNSNDYYSLINKTTGEITKIPIEKEHKDEKK